MRTVRVSLVALLVVVGLSGQSLLAALALVSTDEPVARTVKGVPISKPGDEPTLILTQPTVQGQTALFHVGKPWLSPSESAVLGVGLASVDDVLGAQLRLAKGEGLVVTSVSPRSLGETSGIQVHDVLVKVGDSALKQAGDLDQQLKLASKQSLSVVLYRKGQKQTIRLVGLPVTKDDEEEADYKYWLGTAVDPVDGTLRSQLGLPEKVGLVVTGVVEDSPAAKAGVKQYDVITALNGTSLSEALALVTKIQETKGKPVTLKIIREGKPLTIEATPGERDKEATARYRASLAGIQNAFRQENVTLQRAEELFGIVVDPKTGKTVARRSPLAVVPGVPINGNVIVRHGMKLDRVATPDAQEASIRKLEALLIESQQLLKQIRDQQQKSEDLQRKQFDAFRELYDQSRKNQATKPGK